MVHVLGSRRRDAEVGPRRSTSSSRTRNAIYADAQLPTASTRRALGARRQPTTTRARTARPSWSSSADGTIASIDVGRRPVRVALPGRHRRRADRGPDLPAGPDPVQAPLDRGPRRAPRRGRRDVLRPVADRDERRLRRASSSSPPTPCSPRSGPAGGAGAGRWVVACRSIGLLLGLALASKWVGAVRDRRRRDPDPGPERTRPDAPDPGLIGGTVVLGQHRPDRGPGGARRAARTTCLVFVMVGLTLAGGPVTVLRPVAWTDDETRFGDRRHRRCSGILVFLGCRSPAGVATAAVRRRLDQPSSRSRSPRPDRRLGDRLPALPAGRLVRVRAAGSAARARRSAQRAARAAAPPAAGRLRLGWGFGIPIVWMIGLLVPAARGLRHQLHPVGGSIEQPPAVRGLAAGPHRPDPARADQADVRLPQQPRARPPGVLAVVGLAVRLQARLVLPGELRRQHLGRDLRQRQPRHLVARASRRSPSSPGRRSSGGSLALGPDRDRVLLQWVPWMRIDRATFQYHYYTACRSWSWPWPTSWPSCGTARRARTWLLARVSAAAGSSCRRRCGPPGAAVRVRPRRHRPIRARRPAGVDPGRRPDRRRPSPWSWSSRVGLVLVCPALPGLSRREGRARRRADGRGSRRALPVAGP